MDKKYIELFTELTRATTVSAEQVMDYDKSKDDEQGFKTAQIMRDDYENLHTKLTAADFDGTLTKDEYAKMLVACYINVGNLQDRLNALQKAIAGFQSDLIPRLDKIIAAETEEAAQELAAELLNIKVEE